MQLILQEIHPRKKVEVDVVKDKPVISADKEITYQGKTNVTEAKFLSDIQATVNDELDGNIQVTSDFAEKVNQNKVGIYPVKLDAVDIYGNKANSVTIYVQIENKIAPTLEKIKDQTIEATDKLSELSAIFGIEASDYMTGESLTITYTPDQSIQGNVPGTYPIKVSTKDTAGNTTESNVVLTIVDTTAPTFTAKQSSKKIEINTAAPNWLTFFGIQAIDIVDGDDTKQVKVDASEVKLAQLGEYHVYFTVTDQTGNVANQFITTVQVVDTTPPTLLVTKDKISYRKEKMYQKTNFYKMLVQVQLTITALYQSLPTLPK